MMRLTSTHCLYILCFFWLYLVIVVLAGSAQYLIDTDGMYYSHRTMDVQSLRVLFVQSCSKIFFDTWMYPFLLSGLTVILFESWPRHRIDCNCGHVWISELKLWVPAKDFESGDFSCGVSVHPEEVDAPAIEGRLQVGMGGHVSHSWRFYEGRTFKDMAMKLSRTSISAVFKSIVFFFLFIYFGLITFAISHDRTPFEILLVGIGSVFCCVQCGVELRLPWACLLNDKKIRGLTAKHWLIAIGLV